MRHSVTGPRRAALQEERPCGVAAVRDGKSAGYDLTWELRPGSWSVRTWAWRTSELRRFISGPRGAAIQKDRASKVRLRLAG
ncbi:hypothetical protein NDU88_005998 [Pleurodeles waltl]|uniref:Uncharacterized protein n=1 Tax=Pleurodeles waltl TaxID=8319 RepID=A0AAV7UNC6_PLEWA|nr:hypothetical protein NDU88_005998 [Pleurodeles waltl]